MKVYQEKFQITAPLKEEGAEPWVNVKSTQVKYPQNDLRMPTTGLEEPVTTNMPLSLAGKTDVTDALTTKALDRGFTKHDMLMTDEEYTGEHTSAWYGDAGGFIERNNLLDRM